MAPGIALALFLLVAVAADAAAVTRTVRATGMAPVEGGDRAAAFAEAKRAALRQAVEEGVGVLVSSATRVENFSVIADQILTQTTGYVRRFTLVEESEVEGVYRVVLDAVVDLRDLHRDLAGLRLALSETGNPRVICVGREIVASETGDEEVAWGTVQAELARAVSAHGGGGFCVVVPADTDDVWRTESAAALVVAGEARLAPAAVPVPFGASSLEQTGLTSAAASLEVQLSWSDTRESVGSVASTGRAVAPTWRAAAEGAIQRAVDAVGECIVVSLAEEVRAKAYSPRRVSLQVQAPHDLLGAFEEELRRRVSAIERLERRAYEDGRGLYDLQARAAGFDLARSVSAAGLEAMDVEILHASSNTLSLSLSRPGGQQP